MSNHFDSKGGGQSIAQGDHTIGKQVNNCFRRLLGRIVTTGNQSSAIAAGGNVAVTYGMSMDDAIKLAEKLLAPLQGQLAAKDQQIKALTEAITALSKTGAPAASIKAALQALEQGDTAKAQAVFAEVAAAKEAAGKKNNQEAAEAYRHLGALTAYRKAVELDPDNAVGWNQLGHLLDRTGELEQAEAAWKKSLRLFQEMGHPDAKMMQRWLDDLAR